MEVVMLGNWDDIYAETHEILGLKNENYADYIENIKDQNKVDSSQSEMRTAKILTMLNNKFNKNKITFIKQLGENHPDIRLKYKGMMTNIEVTKITHSDNRFEGGVLRDGHFNFPQSGDIIEHDKVKLMLTSKIVEKAKQYEKWLKREIIDSTQANIIAIDCGELFPTTPVGPLLFSAYNFLKDTKEFHFDINKKLISTPLVSPRDFIHKEKIGHLGKKERITIYNDEILGAIVSAKIKGIFAFFCSIGRVDLQIISINNNLLLDDLYYYLSSKDNMKVNILRHGIFCE